MATGIFISYRRADSRHAAGRLADDLAQTFGSRAIFRDIEGIDPGLDFTKSLEKALNECVVMLVLIGPRWLEQEDAEGRRRLDRPDDWIRLEVATALARDIRVIPVLLEDARRPQASELPADLQVLALRQTLEMSDSRWRGDLQRLVEALQRVPELAPLAGAVASAPAPGRPPPARSSRKALLLGVGLGAAGLLALSLLLAEEEFDAAQDASLALPTAQESLPARTPSPPLPRPGDGGPAIGDVSGLWRTTTGEVYHFEQVGRQVDFVAEAGGQDIGHGRGEFDGAMLRLSMTLRVQGVAMGSARCELQAEPDLRGFAGICHGPNGAFAAQMFR